MEWSSPAWNERDSPPPERATRRPSTVVVVDRQIGSPVADDSGSSPEPSRASPFTAAINSQSKPLNLNVPVFVPVQPISSSPHRLGVLHSTNNNNNSSNTSGGSDLKSVVIDLQQEVARLRESQNALLEFVEQQSIRLRRMGWRLGSYVVGRLHGGHSSNVTGIVVSSDSTTAVTSSLDGTLLFWNLEQGVVSLKVSAHTGGVGCLTQSRDGFFLCSGGADQTVRVWDRKTGSPVCAIRMPALVYSVYVTSKTAAKDDRVLVIAGLASGEIHVYSLDCAALDFSGTLDAETMDTSSDRAFSRLRVLTGHKGPVTSLTADADEWSLFSGSRDSSIRKWDLLSFETTQVCVAQKGGVTSLRCKGQTLFSCGPESVVKRFNVANLAEMLPPFKHTSIVCDIDVDSAGSLLAASGADGLVKIFAVTPGTAECIRTFVEADDTARAPTKVKVSLPPTSGPSPVLVVRLTGELVLSACGKVTLVRQINSM